MLRYAQSNYLGSDHDPFEDIRDWLDFLSAREYLDELLVKKHGLSVAEAKLRGRSIIPHVRIASAYISQSLDGPADLSFLPAYYAILNLLKVYILVGPYHSELPANRWHGVTYDVLAKDSRTILTENITIKKRGVVPLFYKTITGLPLTASALTLQIKGLLPYLSGVSHEYALATGTPALICRFALTFTKDKATGTLYPEIKLEDPRTITRPQLRALKTFRALPGDDKLLRGRRIRTAAQRVSEARSQIKTYLLYRKHHNEGHGYTPICSKRLEIIEELPIALVFFYMSSIVRYKPEFFSRLRDSKYWPVISAARTHSFHAFLLAFWSFMQQRNYFVNYR